MNQIQVGPENETLPLPLLSLSVQKGPVSPQFGELISPTHHKGDGSKTQEQHSDFQKLHLKTQSPTEEQIHDVKSNVSFH